MDGEVLIVGGGLNGPALALALAQGGISSVVIDARQPQARAEAGFDGRSYALSLASQRLLQAVGVWKGLTAQPILKVVASDGRPGQGASPFALRFDAAELEEGPAGYMVEDRHLYAAFLAALQHPLITHRPGETVVAQGEGWVDLASGRRLTGQVVAGCDGRTSGTCARAGIKRQGWSYGQSALVAAIAHEGPHNGVAHQFFMGGGPLAILPLAGGHVSSIVWSEREAEAARIASLDDTGFMAALHPRFGEFLGGITLAGARFTYPLSLTLADHWVKPRLALVGDAAHGVHPIAGQGLNLGLRDVAALAEVLVEARRRGEDIGALNVLERYEHWRRFDTTTLALGMDGVNRLFSNDNSALRGLRDLGMGLINALPGVKRGFLRQAAGLSGRLPKLMAGQGL
jgi:2-octaprenyl-6-methoxyphenol hydroxylase